MILFAKSVCSVNSRLRINLFENIYLLIDSYEHRTSKFPHKFDLFSYEFDECNPSLNFTYRVDLG